VFGSAVFVEVGRLELGRVMCSGEEFGWVLAERSEWVKGFGFGFFAGFLDG